MYLETAKPSNFCGTPWSSISQNAETESIAKNIMRILARDGDEFKLLTFEEYKKARFKDGASEHDLSIEKEYFLKAVEHCQSAKAANNFSNKWYDSNAK